MKKLNIFAILLLFLTSIFLISEDSIDKFTKNFIKIKVTSLDENLKLDKFVLGQSDLIDLEAFFLENNYIYANDNFFKKNKLNENKKYTNDCKIKSDCFKLSFLWELSLESFAEKEFILQPVKMDFYISNEEGKTEKLLDILSENNLEYEIMQKTSVFTMILHILFGTWISFLILFLLSIYREKKLIKEQVLIRKVFGYDLKIDQVYNQFKIKTKISKVDFLILIAVIIFYILANFTIIMTILLFFIVIFGYRLMLLFYYLIKLSIMHKYYKKMDVSAELKYKTPNKKIDIFLFIFRLTTKAIMIVSILILIISFSYNYYLISNYDEWNDVKYYANVRMLNFKNISFEEYSSGKNLNLTRDEIKNKVNYVLKNNSAFYVYPISDLTEEANPLLISNMKYITKTLDNYEDLPNDKNYIFFPKNLQGKELTYLKKFKEYFLFFEEANENNERSNFTKEYLDYNIIYYDNEYYDKFFSYDLNYQENNGFYLMPIIYVIKEPIEDVELSTYVEQEILYEDDNIYQEDYYLKGYYDEYSIDYQREEEKFIPYEIFAKEFSQFLINAFLMLLIFMFSLFVYIITSYYTVNEYFRTHSDEIIIKKIFGKSTFDRYKNILKSEVYLTLLIFLSIFLPSLIISVAVIENFYFWIYMILIILIIILIPLIIYLKIIDYIEKKNVSKFIKGENYD